MIPPGWWGDTKDCLSGQSFNDLPPDDFDEVTSGSLAQTEEVGAQEGLEGGGLVVDVEAADAAIDEGTSPVVTVEVPQTTDTMVEEGTPPVITIEASQGAE
jgi:hypothetical protein